MSRVALCMLAKAPVAGAVKTRLCPPLSPARAAALASAFLVDTWRALGRVEGARRVLMSAGPREAFPAELAAAESRLQCAGDLGARMEHAARAGLELAPCAILVGADAPGLPPALVDRAAAALAEVDAVLGPALDGGYYLLGLRRCEPGLLSDLPWSSEHTLAATRARLRDRGFAVRELPVWFDVDDADGLGLLRAALAGGWIEAPETRRALAEWA